jgi:hypothetical protein
MELLQAAADSLADAKLPVSDEQMANIDATAADVIADVNSLFPLLAPSTPHMVRFIKCLNKQPRVPQVYAIFKRNPKTWASTNPYMDKWFPDKVDNQPEMDLPSFISRKRAHHVKPFCDLSAPLLVMANYPTLNPDSTVHLEYAIMNDISNQSMLKPLHEARHRLRSRHDQKRLPVRPHPSAHGPQGTYGEQIDPSRATSLLVRRGERTSTGFVRHSEDRLACRNLAHRTHTKSSSLRHTLNASGFTTHSVR